MASHDPPPRKEVVEFQVNEDVHSVPDLLAMNNRVIPSQDDLLTSASEIEIKHPGCGAKEVLRLMLEEHPDWPITEKRLHENGLGAPPRDEYYSIKLVPARLLSINVAAHSFKMYFKLYIQVELKDEIVEKYIRTKQEKKEGITSHICPFCGPFSFFILLRFYLFLFYSCAGCGCERR